MINGGMSRDKLLELAEFYEERALHYCPQLFTQDGVPIKYISDHVKEVTYTASCFTIAATLRARAVQ